MTEFVDIKIVSSQQELDDAFSVRQKVFVEEQKIDPSLEFDGNDFSATHLVAYLDKKPVGTVRIRYFSDFVKFERMSVLPEFRKSNISNLLVQTASNLCAQKGYRTIHCACKQELLPRWAKDGAVPIKDAAPVVQNGMTLVAIEQKIPQTKNCINLRTPLDILSKKEGQWFEDNPVENTHELTTKDRLNHIKDMKDKVKNIKKQSDGPRKTYTTPKCDILEIDFTNER